MPQYKVVFNPFAKTVTVPGGTTLLDAALQAHIGLESPCGGDGICGRCKLIVREGRVRGDVSSLLTRDEIRQGYVLACQTFVDSNLVVEIPEKSRVREMITIDKDAQRFRADHPGVKAGKFARAPVVQKLFLKLDPPSLHDNIPDCQRIQAGIQKQTGISAIQTGLKIIQRVSDILRRSNFEVTATIGRRLDVAELMAIEEGDTSDRNLAAVVDLGTSTVVAHLVSLIDGRTIDTQACFNSQAALGREVTARIIAAERSGPGKLQELLVGDINRLIASLTQTNDLRLRDINAVVCAGNTAVTHFLLGLPTRNIRRAPYVDVSKELPPFRAAEVGIKINPRGLLFTVPGIGGWVGGDISAGILATRMYEAKETCLFIDVGTNGEIVLGNKDWLMACSASAGPALEGAGVECGMMAESGAIEKVYVKEGEVRFDVVGGGAPDGICGSGMIDVVATLLRKEVIDRGGQFAPNGDPAVRFEDDSVRYVLADAARSLRGHEVFVSQTDIDNVVTAKAAIFAASKIMLDRLGLKLSDIKHLFLAGGFGSHIDIENAIAIGLLPDLPVARVQYVGNTSIWGAKLAALSSEAFDKLREIVKRTTYYDLMGAADYVAQFQEARFLPHTNIELFPSLLAGKQT